MFGWTYRTLRGDDRPYTLAYHGDVPIGGMIQRRPDARRAEGRWVGFMSVPDVASASRYVVAQGGEVLIERRNLPDRGEAAMLADPDGVPIGVLNSSSGDQDDYLVDPEAGHGRAGSRAAAAGAVSSLVASCRATARPYDGEKPCQHVYAMR
jgi:predicted enzyme related to lactoylglutathione lyase